MSKAGREFISALEELIMALHEEERHLSRDFKLTPIQYIILRRISAGGVTTMSQVAQFLGVKPQTVTHMADALERNGWLKRSRSTSDRRAILLEVTSKGSRMVGRIRSSFQLRLEQVLESVPDSSLLPVAATMRDASNSVRDRGARPSDPR